jgi:hypothetical protein
VRPSPLPEFGCGCLQTSIVSNACELKPIWKKTSITQLTVSSVDEQDDTAEFRQILLERLTDSTVASGYFEQCLSEGSIRMFLTAVRTVVNAVGVSRTLAVFRAFDEEQR